MAIGRISGAMLYENLERQGIPLRFEGDLLYLQVNDNQNSQDGRVGIKTDSPTKDFDVNGTAKLGNIVIDGSSVSSLSGPIDFGAPEDITLAGGSTNYVLTTDGNGNLRWSSIGAIAQAGSATGMDIVLGTPTDGSLQEYASWDSWTSSIYITDAIDDLNQVALNIAKGTYVGEVDFTANVVSGASPLTVQFTGTLTGNPTHYYWDFGDGTTGVAGSTTTHTYNDEDGGRFTVTLVAYNASGTLSGDLSAGARGSVDQKIRTNYITLYTPNPIPSLSLISDTIDTDDVTGLVITDLTRYADTYEIDWGDGEVLVLNAASGLSIDPDTSEVVYDTDRRAAVWAIENQEHVYSNGEDGDTKYDLVLSATSTSAGTTPVTVESDPYPIYVYSEHVTEFTANTTRVVNEQITNGGVVEFTNTTATNPGLTSVFEDNRYKWTWDDGTENTINIDPSVSGNSGTILAHTFTLDTADQTNGNTKSFNVVLETINGHTLSPFSSEPIEIFVEPDVRANFTATATTVSDRVGDSSTVGYVFTDYNGNDRSQFEFTTSSQHADTYEWTWGDGTTTGSINEGTTGTATGGSITHSYTSTGSKTVQLDISGQPDTISQTDSATTTITIAANPVAPDDLSAKTLSMSTSSVGTNAYLAANATNNSNSAMPTAGTSVTRYISGTIATNTITDANTSATGTLVALANGSDIGSVTFSTSTNASGSYDDLEIVDDRDAHLAISSSIYPTGFYKVFDARVSKALSDFSVGYNNIKLSHSVSGDTNAAGFVHDDLTSVPTIDVSSASAIEKTAGTYRYISGVPYYDTDGVVSITGAKVTSWIGQTYYNGYPLTVTDGSNLESTTGNTVLTQYKTYSNIDGAITSLSGGIPIAGTGQSSYYDLGDIDVTVNGSSASVGYLNIQMTNVNGSSTTVQISTPINVYSIPLTGIDEESIPVVLTTGGGYFGQSAKRIKLSSSLATPTYDDTKNYYSTEAWTGDVEIEGTNEAVVRWGQVKNVATDFSTYLPPGPDLATDRVGYQYFTFAFQRDRLQQFDIKLQGKVSGVWLAAPGSTTDQTSTLNGWLDCTTVYAGSGTPGANTTPISATKPGGNGSNGCALTSGDRIPVGVEIDSNSAVNSFTMTLGQETLSNATNNQCFVRIQLAVDDYITSLSIGEATS